MRAASEPETDKKPHGHSRGFFLRPLPFQTAEIRHTVSVTNTRPELKK